MTFAVPASKASIAQNRFSFTLPGSKKKHSLPKLAYTPVGIMSTAFTDPAAPKSDELLALFISLGVDRDAAFTLDNGQLGSIADAWAEASGISLGESSASTDD